MGFGRTDAFKFDAAPMHHMSLKNRPLHSRPSNMGYFVLFNKSTMAPFNLSDTLNSLGLTQVAAARLLSVDPRTVRRWVDNLA